MCNRPHPYQLRAGMLILALACISARVPPICVEGTLLQSRTNPGLVPTFLDLRRLFIGVGLFRSEAHSRTALQN